MLSLRLCLHWERFAWWEHLWGMPEEQPTEPLVAGAQNQGEVPQQHEVFMWEQTSVTAVTAHPSSRPTLQQLCCWHELLLITRILITALHAK